MYGYHFHICAHKRVKQTMVNNAWGRFQNITIDNVFVYVCIKKEADTPQLIERRRMNVNDCLPGIRMLTKSLERKESTTGSRR